MTREQGTAFDEILDYPDQVLLDLLMGNMQSSDQSVNMIVKRIREAVTS
jgi:succinate dehydrogenase flavin-adding protein (antitoxin of CptAB toxin-antitoxin module)